MNKKIWLWLLLVMQPYNENTMKLVEYYGGPLAAAQAIRDGKCNILTSEERARAISVRNKAVDDVIKTCEDNNIRIVTIEDEEYPELLKQIYNPPIVLFVQGSLEGLDELPTLAVVGTRNASEYAMFTGGKICRELVKAGMVLVSGLAMGLDSVAHWAAVNNGSRTIGVLACGNMIDYPALNRDLKKRILETGGALISELLPYTRTAPGYFKYRNRIMSGLSMGTFVIEAPKGSGCIYTAEHAIEQNRDLFCLSPKDVNADSCAGVIPFLRDGAVAVFDHTDIIDAYNEILSYQL